MAAPQKTKFSWWKVAAIIVLVAGGGLMIFQLSSKNKSDNIVQNQGTKNPVVPDSNQTTQPTSQGNSESLTQSSNENSNAITEKTNTGTISITKASVGTGRKKLDSISFTATNKNGETTFYNQTVNNGSKAAAPEKKEIKEDAVVLNESKKQKTADDIKVADKSAATKSGDVDGDGIKDQFEKDQNQLSKPTANAKMSQGIVLADKNNNSFRGNIFRGRVMDANNNPIPFANIMITKDSIGTYSDSKGYFNFISGDTVLNVDIRSVGFSNRNAQLKNRTTNNQIIMQEDRSIAANILDTTTRSNARKNFLEANVTVEEAEPEDGWGLYDTYIVNNLQVPETVKEKKIRGDVQLSFEVDKNGVPTNIKIVKSLCEECDKEAVRLLKEGPKWKKIVKKGKGTVTVSF